MNSRNTEKPLVIVFSNLGLGGIQRKIIDIVNYIYKKDIPIPIVILLRKETPFSMVPHIKNPNVTILTYQKNDAKKYAFGYTFFVLYHVLRLQPRAILSFLSPFALPTLLAKICFFWLKFPVVISQDQYTSSMISTLSYPLLNKIGIILLYRFADVIITPSDASRIDLIHTFHISRKRIQVIYNWTTLTSKVNNKKTWDIVIVSRFVKSKNIMVFLKTLVQLKRRGLKHIRACIIGDGPEKSHYLAFIRTHRLQNNVIIKNPIYDVETILSKAKLFVCTSKYKFEGFPLSVLEAMACGTPVITTDFGSAHEIIKNGKTGIIASTEHQLVESIDYLLSNTQVRERMALSAKRHILKYHSESQIQSYLQLLHIL